MSRLPAENIWWQSDRHVDDGRGQELEMPMVVVSEWLPKDTAYLVCGDIAEGLNGRNVVRLDLRAHWWKRLSRRLLGCLHRTRGSGTR